MRERVSERVNLTKKTEISKYKIVEEERRERTKRKDKERRSEEEKKRRSKGREVGSIGKGKPTIGLG